MVPIWWKFHLIQYCGILNRIDWNPQFSGDGHELASIALK